MKVILYTTHCPKCKVLEMKLKQKGIEYAENDDVNHMLNDLHIKSAPALGVDDMIYTFADAIKWANSQEMTV